jgi:hypothetical protein
VRAQCVDWAGGFEPAGIPDSVHASLVFDSGNGDELYVAGSFRSAGNVAANGIAKWNGTRWAALGSGIDAPELAPLYGPNSVQGAINALAVYDDGSGPALYAGGTFTSIGGVSASNFAKWNGSAWSQVGGGVQQVVYALAAHDDGAGPALFVAGSLQQVGGMPVANCAKWNGSVWTSCSAFVNPNSDLRALCVFDDGSGPVLCGGGGFLFGAVGKWNGTSWSAVGNGGGTLTPYALEVFDDGSGPALYAAGQGLSGWQIPMRKWDGTTWTTIGGITGSQAWIKTLRTFDDGSGPQLYVGGFFNVGSIVSMARWNGTTWSSVGAAGGLGFSPYTTYYPYSRVTSLSVYDDGSAAGPRLHAFGEFESADGHPVINAARYDANGWLPMGSSNAPTSSVTALHAFVDGNGPALYAAGMFQNVGALHSPCVARWNGSSWSALGATLDVTYPSTTIQTLGHFDDGNGAAPFIGGDFSTVNGVSARGVARWNGTAWLPVGAGVSGDVAALELYDDGAGEALYAAGQFTQAGGLSARRIAKWNGSTWSKLGAGLDLPAYAMTVFDDGSGPKLYVGGRFSHAGAQSAPFLAAWNGTSWSDVGGGLDDRVYALAVHDDGSGPALYAGGWFGSAGPINAGFVARWNGTHWSAVPGLTNWVYALASFDDGNGSRLYASVADPNGGRRLHRWDGSAWTEFAPVGGTVSAIEPFDDGSGDALYFGGDFAAIGARASANLAKWSRACSCPPLGYCTAGTTTHGCNAHIVGIGSPSASSGSGFELVVDHVEGRRTGLIFYGTSGAKLDPWGSGPSFVCVKAPQQRTGNQFSSGTNGACDGVLSLDFNAYLASHPNSLGQPFGSITTVWAQAWFRDPPAPKGTNLSDAVQFDVCP